jgi:hypothetical protein
MVLKEIFVLKREAVAGGWTKMHSKELHDWYCSLYIIRVIKSGKMDWQGMWHV